MGDLESTPTPFDKDLSTYIAQPKAARLTPHYNQTVLMDVDTNAALGGAEKLTTAKAITPMGRRALSPPGNNTADESAARTRAVQNSEFDQQEEADPRKRHRPVSRRFSAVFQPFDKSQLSELVEGAEPCNEEGHDGQDEFENFVSGAPAGMPGQRRQTNTRHEYEYDGDSEPGDRQHDGADDKWDVVMNSISRCNLKDALSIALSDEAPTGKTESASAITMFTLKLKRHEADFRGVGRNNVLTPGQARAYIEKNLAGDKSPFKAFRAACRTKGPDVNRTAKAILTLCDQHGLKQSTSAAILVDTVCKKSDECEPFEQRTDMTAEYFLRTEKTEWISFMRNTAKGIIKPPRNTPLDDQPGTAMLHQDHEDCEEAWTVLATGIINSLSHTSDSGTQWVTDYAQWLAMDLVHTIGITTIHGKFPPQKKGEDVDDLLHRMTRASERLRIQMQLAQMRSDIPTGNALVGNLWASANPDYVRDTKRRIRDDVTIQNKGRPITIEKLITMLKDSEARMGMSILGQSDRRENDRKQGQGGKGKRGGKGKGRQLTEEQIRAITNYSKENKLEWASVRLEDVTATQEGVAGWAEKSEARARTTDEKHPSAHPAAPGKGGKTAPPTGKVECRYYQQGSCKKGDQCTFMHTASAVTKKNTTVAHQRNDDDDDQDAESEDDTDDEYECHPAQTSSENGKWTDHQTDSTDSDSRYRQRQRRYHHDGALTQRDRVQHSTHRGRRAGQRNRLDTDRRVRAVPALGGHDMATIRRRADPRTRAKEARDTTPRRRISA